jgi:thiol-disulfide isomerase/thioredoxin
MILSGCATGKHLNKNTSSHLPDKKEAVSIDYMDQSTWLLGYINVSQFKRFPHSEWYIRGYEAYKPDQEVLAKLKMIDQDPVSIQIVMGTWCPDSRREVPRFMKILTLWEFNIEKVTFIGVDNTKNAPVVGYEELGIERVPTFIILENKVEKGRIIENPVTSLEQDMLGILTRNEK